MSLPVQASDGSIYANTGGVPAVYNAGLAYDATGRLLVTTTRSASDVYLAGRRVAANGALVVADGLVADRPYVFNGGWPTSVRNFGTIRQVGNTPGATDPFINSARVGPLGGVYMLNSAPP